MLVKTQVTQKHGGRKNHGGGVSLVTALNVQTNVSATGLKDSVFTTNVDTRNKTGTSDKTGTNVRENGTVQVRGDENVELLGPGDSLHRCIVNNHVAVFNLGILLTDFFNGGAEETVSELHNVGLVNSSDLLTVVLESKVVGKACNTLGLVLGDDLKRLHNARNRLVLEARVLTLGVFTDQGHVDILQTGLDTGNVLDKNKGSVNIQLPTQGNVKGSMARLFNGGVENSLQTDLISLERVDGLGDTLAAVTNTRDLNLFPVYGDVFSLENALDRVGDFSTNSVTYQNEMLVFKFIRGFCEGENVSVQRHDI